MSSTLTGSDVTPNAMTALFTEATFTPVKFKSFHSSAGQITNAIKQEISSLTYLLYTC